MDYLVIKTAHQLTVACSVSLFSLRAIGSLRGAQWPKRRLLRIGQHANDTGLLLSAVSLALLSGIAPWNAPWLAVKIAGLLLYICLGTLVMQVQLSALARWLSFVAALLVFSFIVSVAITRSALGFFG